MTEYGDDVRLEELLAPLRRLEPVPFAVSEKTTPRLRRPVLVAAIVIVALALTGVAIADSVGVFNGIGAAQRSQNGSDVLDPRVAKFCPSDSEAFYDPFCHLVPSSVRLISTASGHKIYVVADTRGDLCTISYPGGSCGPPLSESHPITFGTFNRSPTTGGTFIASGLAIDGVTSVSFTVWGREVTVPVKDNSWVYERPNSTAHDAGCIVAHMADGSTVKPFPEVPCP
jgi:hypothetical protein